MRRRRTIPKRLKTKNQKRLSKSKKSELLSTITLLKSKLLELVLPATPKRQEHTRSNQPRELK